MARSNQAAVLFISGQSNAHAHGQQLPECARITVPLKNVFSLDRNPNQSFDITQVVWSGFTTMGKNLGESQDHTASFGYYFAKLWQDAIDNGADLPNLYIVQISVGSQGIINGMWNPDCEKTMIPGPLGKVAISLFPWMKQIIRLTMDSFFCRGVTPEVIGWHWLGSEQEVWHQAYLREDFQSRYDLFFQTMLETIDMPCKLYAYKIHFEKACAAFGLPEDASAYINAELMRQCQKHGGTLVDAAQCPYWNAEDERFGIFKDTGHYLPKVQQWFAEQFFEEVCK